MSTATPRPPPRPGTSISLPAPSPSRSNPFARPALPKAASTFSRTCLLPTMPSPAKAAVGGIDGTPSERVADGASVGSAGKGRSAWRMLWRGGLEIGPEGFRLEGITFFALLNFPSTPTHPTANPFDVPISTPSYLPNLTSCHSPFSLPSADTDICLSLESMRGRKYLQIRGMTDLADTDILEGSDEGGGVQMAISPTSLLVSYFTGLLCRDSNLPPSGRTRKAIRIGLGDDDSPQNTLLVYGQLQPQATTLRLLVSRRRPPPPPPSEVKVRPGEPLPRIPLFFPANARKPLPFPNRSNLGKSRSFSRTSSVSSIYAPPLSTAGAVEMKPPAMAKVTGQAHAPVSGRTPGRRGEKRPRKEADDEDRRRKSGKVVMIKEERVEVKFEDAAGGLEESQDGADVKADEDIFGKRPLNVEGLHPSSDAAAAGEASTSSKKRARVPQQVLDNKALIRKQAMVLMESRGYPRDHEQFKDVFAMTTKGVYFVFRDLLLDAPLDKIIIQSYVARHLDMYLPPKRPEASSEASGEGEDTAVDVDDETLVSIKDEVVIKEEEERLFGDEDAERPDMPDVLRVGVLDSDADEGSRRSSMSRSRSMGVVEEEDEE